MSKSDIFQCTIRAVATVTCVAESTILSRSRREEVSDARHILIHLLRERGFNPREIAERLNISVKAVEKHIGVALSKLRLAMARQSVNEALDGFEHRSRRPMIADNLREIRRLLSESRPVGE